MRALALLLIVLAAAAPPRLRAESASATLQALADAEWQYRLQENPLLATSAGDHRYDDRLPSMTKADLARRAAHDRETLEKVRALDRAALTPSEKASAEILARELSDAVAAYDFGAYRIPLTSDSGFHTDFADLPDRMTFSSVRDYDNYVARLKAFPQYVAEEIALMREGIAAGFTLPGVVLEGYEVTMTTHVVTAPEKSVFFAPFRQYPAGVPEADRARLTAAGRRAVLDGAVAGYRALADFMRTEYVPRARTTIAASALPKGKDYYAQLVRSFTTLDVSAAQVHEIGRQEVLRIRAEMDAVIAKTGFMGNFEAFLNFLRTDPKFYAKTGEDLLKDASYIAKRMDGKLPSLFGKLPRLPYGVEPVPAHLAPKYTGGRYIPAPIGGTQAGEYWVNTYALDKRPLYVLEALTLHEAVPGHHLQIALQQELTGLPEFRRFSEVGAFVEGWALYAERLGLEAGFYRDPYSDFGRLTYEMWRACRLVVDTGIHAEGWTRAEAIEYLETHTALSTHEVATEIDRYISWPGQALCYKMGELKIRELRRQAEETLGPKFDVRSFHDAVLGQGAVPLSVLEEQVRAWVAARQAA
ncbi:MAG TPA: DUF885 domain-containing protein [Thermoanaerobaculia bacterium]|nr:DUF885 domain-containing protein [Thermoanaerobaculia bacterium]